MRLYPEAVAVCSHSEFVRQRNRPKGMKTALMTGVLALTFSLAPVPQAFADDPPPPSTDVVPPPGDVTDEEWYDEWCEFLRLIYILFGGNPEDLELPEPPSPQP